MRVENPQKGEESMTAIFVTDKNGKEQRMRTTNIAEFMGWHAHRIVNGESCINWQNITKIEQREVSE